MLICDLMKLGIAYKKTYESSSFVFDNIPNELKRHFIRGYMDGDGSIGVYRNRAVVGFVSLNEK